MKTSYRSGSALVVAICVIAILSLIGGTAIRFILNNRSTLNQAVSWQEALLAAEAGAHQGIAQVQNQFLPLLNQDVPPNLSGTQSINLSLTHSGEGIQTIGAQYLLTGTYCTVGVSGTAVRPYFRIVSTGSAQISGARSYSNNSKDVVLRKLGLGSNVQTASRQVEVWLRPTYSQDSALTTNGLISLNNHNITVDSFDSKSYANAVPRTEPMKDAYGNVIKDLLGNPVYGPNSIISYYNSKAINNTNGGTLDRNYFYAGIGTNGQMILAGGSYIYGDAMTNGGVITNPSHVYGIIDDEFYQPLSTVSVPNGTFSYPTSNTGNSSQSQITTVTTLKNNNTQNLYGGSQASPARYKLDSISLTGNGLLTFKLGTTGSTASTNLKYIELYVPGDFKTKGGGNGDGSLIIDSGVVVTIYVGGNIALGGNGIVNNNGTASSLTIKGITPTDGSTRTADFGGTSTFYGVVYAPDYDLKLGGTPTYIGSLVGKTATLVGNVNIRYDEALAGAGTIMGYKVVSWFENTKKVP